MQVNGLSQTQHNQSFGRVKMVKMTQQTRDIVSEKILSKIDGNLIDDLDNMGVDIVFRRGAGVEGNEFDIDLFDRVRKKQWGVADMDIKRNYDDEMRKLPQRIIKSFMRMCESDY